MRFKTYLYIGLVFLALTMAGTLYLKIQNDAVAHYQNKEFKVERKKIENATKADATARRCSLDTACRVRNDGFRRD